MITLSYLSLLVAFCASLSNGETTAQEAQEGECSSLKGSAILGDEEGDDHIQLDVLLTGRSLFIHMSSKKDWFAVGLSETGMVGARAWISMSDDVDETSFGDYDIVNRTPDGVVKDRSVTDLPNVYIVDNERFVMFWRQLSESDAEKACDSLSLSMVFAFGSLPFGYHGPGGRGEFLMSLAFKEPELTASPTVVPTFSPTEESGSLDEVSESDDSEDELVVEPEVETEKPCDTDQDSTDEPVTELIAPTHTGEPTTPTHTGEPITELVAPEPNTELFAPESDTDPVNPFAPEEHISCGFAGKLSKGVRGLKKKVSLPSPKQKTACECKDACIEVGADMFLFKSSKNKCLCFECPSTSPECVPESINLKSDSQEIVGFIGRILV